jgi:hypothetical protein
MEIINYFEFHPSDSPQRSVLLPQDLFTEPQEDAVDGFVEGDNEVGKDVPRRKEARPVFSIFNRKKVRD